MFNLLLLIIIIKNNLGMTFEQAQDIAKNYQQSRMINKNKKQDENGMEFESEGEE